MIPDGTYTGVIDRSEEDADGTELAVILLEEGEETVGQIEVPRPELPAGAERDAVVTVSIVDGDVDAVEYAPDETRERRESAQDRFDRLADRPPSEPDSEESRDDQER